MLQLISAVLTFGELKEALLVLQENADAAATREKKRKRKSEGFFAAIIDFFCSTTEKTDYEIVQDYLESYKNASEEYKAEIIKILRECDEKLYALEEKFEQQEDAAIKASEQTELNTETSKTSKSLIFKVNATPES